jgi:hypothetical protein
VNAAEAIKRGLERSARRKEPLTTIRPASVEGPAPLPVA